MTQKEKAIELMKKLKIYSPYIKGFEDKDRVCFFEGFAGFWDDQEPDIETKRKELEREHHCMIYATTHEKLYGDDVYSFLMVSNYPEEWDDLVTKDDGNFYAFAYVWNRSCDWCSEFGDVVVQSAGGGIRRVA